MFVGSCNEVFADIVLRVHIHMVFAIYGYMFVDIVLRVHIHMVFAIYGYMFVETRISIFCQMYVSSFIVVVQVFVVTGCCHVGVPEKTRHIHRLTN